MISIGDYSNISRSIFANIETHHQRALSINSNNLSGFDSTVPRKDDVSEADHKHAIIVGTFSPASIDAAESADEYKWSTKKFRFTTEHTHSSWLQSLRLFDTRCHLLSRYLQMQVYQG